jgi:hypothetical protein
MQRNKINFILRMLYFAVFRVMPFKKCSKVIYAGRLLSYLENSFSKQQLLIISRPRKKEIKITSFNS